MISPMADNLIALDPHCVVGSRAIDIRTVRYSLW
jgi:hypothetical protein